HVGLDDEDQRAADQRRERNRQKALRQFPAETRGNEAADRGNEESDGQLGEIVAILRLVEACHQSPQSAPVDQQNGGDGTGLDGDIEELRALAEPALCDEQMPGARDGKKLGY